MDKHSPKYIAIYHALKTDILSEKYPVGSFLPPEGELEKIYSASRTTIRSAISMLKNEHLVDVRQGRGTEVLQAKKIYDSFNFPSLGNIATVSNKFLTSDGSNTAAQAAVIDLVHPEPKVVSALNLGPDDMVYRLQRVKYVDDIVFCYVVSYVPCNIAPGLDKYSSQFNFLYKFLQDNYDIVYTSSHMSLSAISAGFLESKLLNVNPGTSLLLDTRITYSKEGPFEYAESFIRPDIMQITVDFSDIHPPF